MPCNENLFFAPASMSSEFKVTMLTCDPRLCTTIQYVIRRHSHVSPTCCTDAGCTERLDVPTCRLSTVGDRVFPVAGAKVWNGLPSDVTSASSLAVLKNRLKTCSTDATKLFDWIIVSFPSNFTFLRTVVLATVSTI